MKVRDVIAELEMFSPDYEIVSVWWTKDDIEGFSHDDLGIPLSDEQISEIISIAELSFSAQTGINWDVIEKIIREVTNGKRNRENRETGDSEEN